MERGVSTGTRIKADQGHGDAGHPHRAMTERILELAGQAGYKAALIDAVAGTVTAWPRFAWTVRAAAHGLSRRGLADGDTAAVFVPDAVNFAIAVNAVRAAGAMVLPIGPDAAMAELAAQLNAAARGCSSARPRWPRSRCRPPIVPGCGRCSRSARPPGPLRSDSLLSAGKHQADGQMAEVFGPRGHPDPAAVLDALTCPGGRAGLSHWDVVVAAPPCGEGQAYASLLDLTLLAGATIVAAPVPLVTPALRVYQGTAAIVPAGPDGRHVAGPGLRPRLTRGRRTSPQDVMTLSRAFRAGAGSVASFLDRIRVTITSRLHTSRMAAKPNAAAIPWVSTCCAAASGGCP